MPATRPGRSALAFGRRHLCHEEGTTISASIDDQTAREIGAEAYLYLYPLVTMDVTRRQATNAGGESSIFGPANAFHHLRQFPAADFKLVVRPNFDTLYSAAWLDLTAEPMVVSAADTGGRYYMLPMLDMWTDVFAAPGKRTTGTGPGEFAVVPPAWQGTLPHGVQRIDAPTPYVWIIGRTQTNGPSDYAAVHEVQDGFRISALSHFGEDVAGQVELDPSVDMKTPTVKQVNGMSAADYFAYGAELMKLHPPHITDSAQLARVSRLGLVPGQSFHWEAIDPALRKALEGVPAEAVQTMQAGISSFGRMVNGWSLSTDSVGVYGNNYLKRAVTSMIGLGANPPEDAVYPLNIADADGDPLTGDRDYRLHFAPAELPPVDAFWSVTMYDAEGFQAVNALNRFAIGDRDALIYNEDGSLDLYVQHESPGAGKESNWLPAPRGALGVTMRLYAPKASVLRGAWAPPPITKA